MVKGKKNSASGRNMSGRVLVADEFPSCCAIELRMSIGKASLRSYHKEKPLVSSVSKTPIVDGDHESQW